jgi:hypothetical protein
MGRPTTLLVGPLATLVNLVGHPTLSHEDIQMGRPTLPSLRLKCDIPLSFLGQPMGRPINLLLGP